MTTEDLKPEDVEVIFEALRAVSWALLKAHGIDVREVTIKEFDVKEYVDGVQGIDTGLWCSKVNQNGEIEFFKCPD
jgi:hypothetical protein